MAGTRRTTRCERGTRWSKRFRDCFTKDGLELEKNKRKYGKKLMVSLRKNSAFRKLKATPKRFKCARGTRQTPPGSKICKTWGVN